MKITDKLKQKVFSGIEKVISGEIDQIYFDCILPITEIKKFISENYWINTGNLSDYILMENRCDFGTEMLFRIGDKYFSVKLDCYYDLKMKFNSITEERFNIYKIK